MLNYKDMSWCSVYSSGDCKNITCPYAFTENQRKFAIRWWGNKNLPIMMTDRKTADCGYDNGL